MQFQAVAHKNPLPCATCAPGDRSAGPLPTPEGPEHTSHMNYSAPGQSLTLSASASRVKL